MLPAPEVACEAIEPAPEVKLLTTLFTEPDKMR